MIQTQLRFEPVKHSVWYSSHIGWESAQEFQAAQLHSHAQTGVLVTATCDQVEVFGLQLEVGGELVCGWVAGVLAVIAVLA